MAGSELDDLDFDLGPELPLPPPTGPDRDDGPSPAAVVHAARRFHRRLRNRLNEALEMIGLSYAQFEVLELLGEDRNLHAGSIAQRVGTTRQAVHALVRRLADRGFVRILGWDTGVRGLELTDDGRRMLDRCRDALEPFFLLLGRLTAEERRALHDTLQAAEAALRPPPRWL